MRDERAALVVQFLHRFWIGRLDARIRRLSRKQDRLSKARADAMIYAAKHRRKLG